MRRIKENVCRCIQQLINECECIDSVEYRILSQIQNSVNHMSETFDDKIRQVDSINKNCHIYVSDNPTMHITQLIGSLYVLLQSGMNVYFEFESYNNSTSNILLFKTINALSDTIEEIHIIMPEMKQYIEFHSRTRW